MLLVCNPKILRKHCLQFLLGVQMASRETENNALAKFWGDKQRALWYVGQLPAAVRGMSPLSSIEIEAIKPAERQLRTRIAELREAYRIRCRQKAVH